MESLSQARRREPKVNKSFYTEFARHCLRFYARYPEPTFKRKSDEANWKAAETVYDSLSDFDKQIVTGVYGEKDTIEDNVYNLSKKINVNQSSIWNRMIQIEEKVGRERGLIG